MALALPAPQAATTFADLFNDATKDPFIENGNYDSFLAPFTITVAGGLNETPDVVRNLLAAASNQRLPIAILLLVDGRLRPYFLPFRRELAMGAPPHPATDGKLFAFDGELIHGHGPLIEIPNQWFNLAPVVTVPTAANIAAQLAANPHLNIVGPYAAGDADTVEIRTRSLMAVPNKYVGLFLSQPDGVTPRYYFETILPVIEADGLGQTCMPLTQFCQMVFTMTAAGGLSPIQVVEPTPPGRHVPLFTQAMELLHHHLPALGPGGVKNFDLQPLVNTIVAGQQQRQVEQAQARADKQSKDTVESWLGPENFSKLLRYCGVAVEADLPPLWPALAKANSKDRLGIFQGKVASEFLALGAVYEKYTPSLFLLTEITSLRWAMINADALDSGSLGNAFLFTDSDVEAEQGISRQIGIIQSGGAAPSLADAQQLLKMKVNLPGPEDSIRAVRRLQAVCRAVLPVAHPITQFLGQHYNAMRAFDPGWQTYSTPLPEFRVLKGVFHLQWLSLRLSKYFMQHDQNLPVVFAPDPSAIIDSILEQKQWEPNLTDVFMSRYNLQAFVAVHTRGPATVATASTMGSTTPSIVSGLTTPSVGAATPHRQASSAGGGGTRPGGSGERVEHTHFNTTLFGSYQTSSIKSKELRKKIDRGELPPLPPSRIDAAKPVCLAWHTKGQCNTLCPLIADHVAYTADQYEPLATWCREHGYASV